MIPVHKSLDFWKKDGFDPPRKALVIDSDCGLGLVTVTICGDDVVPLACSPKSIVFVDSTATGAKAVPVRAWLWPWRLPKLR